MAGEGSARSSPSSAAPTAITPPARAPLPLAVASTVVSDEMRSLLDGQKKIHEQILKLQAQIEEDEAAYLEETSHGNIIRGWDGFIDSKQSRKDAALKKVKPYSESEHLFSSCCFYSTLADEPSIDLVDYHRREESSGRRRVATPAAALPAASSATSGASTTLSRSSSSTALLKQALERKSSIGGASVAASGTSTPPSLGRPPKIKKRKRLDRLDVVSTASATQSEAGDDDDREPSVPPPPSLKKSRSAVSEAVDSGDIMDML